jgi:hypothetical protein
MYYGDRDGLVEWFASRGYHYDAALHGVASDWALDLVAIGFHKPKRFYGHTITNKEQLFSASAAFVARYREVHGLSGDGAAAEHASGGHQGGLAGKIRGAMRRSSAGGRGRGGGARGGSGSGPEALAAPSGAVWVTGWWSQYYSCLGRELLAVTRNPADVAGRTLTFSWVALLMGLLYFNMPLDASSLRGRLNLLFNGLVFFCLMPYVSMSLYTADKKFYIADASAKLYRAHAYYAAKVRVPPLGAPAGCPCWPPCGAPPGARATARAPPKPPPQPPPDTTTPLPPPPSPPPRPPRPCRSRSCLP